VGAHHRLGAVVLVSFPTLTLTKSAIAEGPRDALSVEILQLRSLPSIYQSGKFGEVRSIRFWFKEARSSSLKKVKK